MTNPDHFHLQPQAVPDTSAPGPEVSELDASERERLEKFDALLTDLKQEYAQVDAQVEELKRQDKTRSATFKQIIARKLSLRQFLDTFAHHGL